MLTDMHSHSSFSHDGRVDLAEMIDCAIENGLAFYGVSDHFDFDYDPALCEKSELPKSDAQTEEFYHRARHLQEDYEGVINVSVGAEFGFSEDPSIEKRYQDFYEKFRPDFVINSVHSLNGVDYCKKGFPNDKKEVYRKYLQLIRKSLDVSYPYDIVGHIGYVARYVSFEDRAFSLEEFGVEIDDIFKRIIEKDKILEVNSKSKVAGQWALPAENLLRRYYELGGRKISFGSDAHTKDGMAYNREEVVNKLKEIGFTHITVPYRGERILVEL